MKTKMQIIETLKNYKQLGDLILDYNTNYKSFNKDLIEIRREIESDLVSAATIPNCSCSRKVKEDIFNHLDIYIECFLNFLEKEKIFFDLDQYDNSRVQNSFSGKIAKTTISEWKSFCEEVNAVGANYKNFSVVKENEDIYVFFL
jgi:hypothetical protein